MPRDRRPARIALLVLLPLCVLIVLDQLIFRSHVYRDWIEPESTAGTTLYGLRYATHLYTPGKDNVLLIGDSRVGEGVSARIVNGVLGGASRFQLVLLPIAGSTPRVWHYVLREADPDATRYRAIILMADTLRDDDSAENALVDRTLDLNYLAPIVTPWDGLSLQATFRARGARMQAVRTCLLSGHALQKDVQSFLLSPSARVAKVRAWAQHRNQDVDAYPGRDVRLPALNWRVGDPAPTAAFPREQAANWQAYFSKLAEAARARGTNSVQDGYRRHWFARIIERYRRSGTAVFVLLMPRGPYHAVVSPPAAPEGVLAEFASHGELEILPHRFALAFEHPEYFADWLHLNKDGREGFSRALGSVLTASLPRPAQPF